MAYTPLSPLRPMARLGANQLSPDDEESLIGSIGRTGLSGLAGIGNILDVPGATVRNALSWLPGGKQANLLAPLLSPWSGEGRVSGRDLLTDVLGVRQNKETGIGGWTDPLEMLYDIGGFGAELATDPLLPLSLGKQALTGAGRVASKAGLLKDAGYAAARNLAKPLGSVGPRVARMTTTLDDLLKHASDPAAALKKLEQAHGGTLSPEMLSEKLGGVAKYGSSVLGAGGPIPEKIAATFDKYSPNIFGGEFGTHIPVIGSQKPLGSAIKALMHAPTMGRMTPEVAAHAQAFFDDQGRALSHARTQMADWALRAQRSGVYDSRQTRRAAEGVVGASDPTGIADEMRAVLGKMPDEEEAAGFRSRKFQDEYIDYLPSTVEGHSTIGAANELQQKQAGPFGVGMSSDQQPREELFKGIPGGREELNDLASHPKLHDLLEAGKTAGVARDTLSKDVATEMKKLFPGIDPEIAKTINDGKTFVFDLGGGKEMKLNAAKVAEGLWTRDAAGNKIWLGHGSGTMGVGYWRPKTRDRYEALADWLYDNPQLKTEGLFTKDPIVEVGARIAKKLERENTAKHFLNFASDHVQPTGTLDDNEAVKLGDLFEKVGMDRELGALAFARKNGMAVPMTKEEIRVAAGSGRITPSDALLRLDELKNFKNDIGNRQISKRLADDFTKPIWNPSAKGTPFESLVSKLDSFTSLFKASVLSWPSTKVRDLASGQIENIVRRMSSGADARDAKALMSGTAAKGAASNPAIAELLRRRGLPATDEAASDLIRNLYAGHSGGSIAATAGDLTQQTAPVYGKGRDELLALIPGAKSKGFWQAAGETGKTFADLKLNPLSKDFWSQFMDVRGVGGRTETNFGPVAAAERVGSATDMANRLVPFLNQLKKGVDPYEAMQRVAGAQVDYSPRGFTAAERAIKRIMPFYSFTRGKTADIGAELLSRPGSGTSQLVRAIKSPRSNEDLLPEHVSQGTAIPVPGGGPGNKRFLTGLGLMLEDPLSMLGSPKSAGLELLSKTNPLIKGPLEAITGQTFFQKGPSGGRRLEDLDPTVGRILSNLTGQEKAVRTPQWMESLLGNLPGSRLLTTARTLTDPRKGAGAKALNTLTGLRLSDVSPANQDAVLRDLMNPIEKELGAKEFARIYFPKELLATMPPAQREQALKLQALENLLAKRAKARKSAKAHGQ